MMHEVRRFSLALSLVLLVTIASRSTANEPVFGLQQRPQWRNERLLGFPDPLPPYRVQRAYPKLTIPKLMAVGSFPASDTMWILNHDGDYGGKGRIHQIPDDPNVEQLKLLLEIDEIIYGMAFHPSFSENGYVYVGCNGKSEALGEVATKVLRFTLDAKPPFDLASDSKKLIIEWPSNGHNGGDLAFGNDGMLYVSAGDGTSDSDTNLTAQDLTSINGSMIRIDVDHPSGELPYSVPKDNPFLNVPGARPEIWAFGLRNPWRVTYDKQSDQLWVGNNGQDLWESAHLIRKGENYGWSVMEGSHAFQIHRKQGPAPFTAPTVEHPHSEARSLTGGIVYRGQKHPELVGAYIYGDYSTGNIWAVKHDGQKVVWHRHLARSILQISGFGADTHGELVVADHEGGLYNLVVQPPVTDAPPFPTRLSETGLFKDLRQGLMADGLISYSVQSPLWSDGAIKDRYMAVPSDKQVEFTETWGWKFPAQSVLVKTFSLPMADREVVKERRIETRLMVKVDNEWYGYSYAWRTDQSDAELVASGGRDETFRVAEPVEGKIKQDDLAWHYPSRVECMVCHSRAANYVLGLSTAQMNRDHDYGGVTDNQLRTLAHIGLLKMPSEKKSGEKKTAEKPKEESDGSSQETDVASAEPLPKPASQYKRLAAPDDSSQPLEARVRSYLQSNCAHCHTNAGGGNSKMELTADAGLDKMVILDAVPQHDSFKIADAKLIAPGAPERSLMLHRITKRGPGQMPPLATVKPDPVATKLLKEWIESLAQPAN